MTYHVIKIHERIIDGSDLDVGVLEGSAKDKTANATETIDTNVNRHFAVSIREYLSEKARSKVCPREEKEKKKERVRGHLKL